MAIITIFAFFPYILVLRISSTRILRYLSTLATYLIFVLKASSLTLIYKASFFLIEVNYYLLIY